MRSISQNLSSKSENEYVKNINSPSKMNIGRLGGSRETEGVGSKRGLALLSFCCDIEIARLVGSFIVQPILISP